MSPDAAERIYILGVGSVGMLVAHALRGVPDPPRVTLLLHRIALAEKWKSAGEEIILKTDGQEEPRNGFDVEMAIPPFRRHSKVLTPEASDNFDDFRRQNIGLKEELPRQLEQSSNDEAFLPNQGPKIRNVVVTVKAPSTVPALLSIKHRLTPESTVLFLQNGMGIIEEVNKLVFPDPAKRPNYLLGINSHGVYSEKSFVATHAGFGTISLGLPARLSTHTPRAPSNAFGDSETSAKSDIDIAPSSRYLLRTLNRAPVLAAASFPPVELLKQQLDKLAVNCVINPLTTVLDCRNGSLLFNMAVMRCMRLMLSEISSVFIRLPELQGLPNINTRFSPERLETLSIGIAKKTGENISSMLADVRRGGQTEIDYINGYVVKRGEELGIHPGFNYMMQQLVRAKQQMIHLEDEDELPIQQQ